MPETLFLSYKTTQFLSTITMKNLTLKSFLFVCMAMVLSTTFSACKKKSDDPAAEGSAAPKEVSITYTVSKTKGGITGAEMTYLNEQGAEVNTGLVAIPWTITLKRTVKSGDQAYVIGNNKNPNQFNKGLKAEVSVDGKVMASATDEGGSDNFLISTIASWTF